MAQNKQKMAREGIAIPVTQQTLKDVITNNRDLDVEGIMMLRPEPPVNGFYSYRNLADTADINIKDIKVAAAVEYLLGVAVMRGRVKFDEVTFTKLTQYVHANDRAAFLILAPDILKYMGR